MIFKQKLLIIINILEKSIHNTVDQLSSPNQTWTLLYPINYKFVFHLINDDNSNKMDEPKLVSVYKYKFISRVYINQLEY